ncbi:platelet-activating factor acetylhydrolase IB subunit beta homolog [Culicoides brevitarsis]|uniref:platelet-activating factor acetylhydrolase IB subunit beta homolog n=1 Tax=Culicoides brevitarsis TaxID=469753 RepID=UPI00307BE33F
MTTKNSIVAEEFVDNDGDNRWIDIHNRFLQECKEKDPDVIFLGDCIVEGLQFTDIWNSFFGPLHCLNFGIRNDKVENVLWRVENGTLDNVNPKVVVLHVGTLNTQHSVDQIVEGIDLIISRIRNKLPNTYIVFPSLLPRGHTKNKLREKNEQINAQLAEKYSGKNRIQIVRVEKGLLQSDGTLSHHDMFDYLNLTNAGAKKVFEPISDLLNQILNEGEAEKDLTPSE